MQQQARVIFSTGSLYLLDLAHYFELAAEAGFDGIEVMCDTVYSSRDPIYLQTLSERYDLRYLWCTRRLSRGCPGGNVPMMRWHGFNTHYNSLKHWVLKPLSFMSTKIRDLPDWSGQAKTSHPTTE